MVSWARRLEPVLERPSPKARTMHASRSPSLTTGERYPRERRHLEARQEQVLARAAEHDRLRQAHAAACLLLATLGRRHGPLD
jgi:hypothetical protein